MKIIVSLNALLFCFYINTMQNLKTLEKNIYNLAKIIANSTDDSRDNIHFDVYQDVTLGYTSPDDFIDFKITDDGYGHITEKYTLRNLKGKEKGELEVIILERVYKIIEEKEKKNKKKQKLQRTHERAT